MSNEYIVVNAKNEKSPIWATIASTYTPKAGEVCIIVPNGSTFDYSIQEEFGKDIVTRDPKKPTIGIKLGDGVHVFNELPLLTDFSSIRPDWNETNTSSHNYIWHKPLTNGDMFILGDRRALNITDQDIKRIREARDIKIFHEEEYYFVKDLMSGEYFTHPNDLLIEEDNTWGHYDVIYNDIETNHEPRFFYSNNITKEIENIKYKEDNSTYQYRLERLLYTLIEDTFKYDSSYLNLLSHRIVQFDYNLPVEQSVIASLNLDSLTTYQFKDTGDKYYNFKQYSDGTFSLEEVSFYERIDVKNFINALVDRLSDYLFKNSGEIEFSVVYTYVREEVSNEDYWRVDGTLIRVFAGYLYETMIRYETHNEIVLRSLEAVTEYYEINDELIIDMATRYLYFKKSRLDYYYDQAHGKQSYTKVFPAGTSQLELPFLIDLDDTYGEDFTIHIEEGKESQIVDFEGPTDLVIYPLPKINSKLEDDIKDVTINVKIKDVTKQSVYKEHEGEDGEMLPTESGVTPSEFKFTNADTIKISVKPIDPEWTINYYDKNDPEYVLIDKNNPLTALSFQQGLEKGVRLLSEYVNTNVTVSYYKNGINDENGLNIVHLYPMQDFYLDDVKDSSGKIKTIVKLHQEITEPCIINFVVVKESYPVNYTWTTAIEDGEVVENREFILETKLYGEGSFIFEKIGDSYNLTMDTEDSKKKFTVNNDTNEIRLAKETSGPCIITFKRGNFNAIIKSIDYINGIAHLENPFVLDTKVYFTKNADVHGDLKIRIYYKLRRIDERYLSGLQSNWNTSNSLSMSYIFNRPFWRSGSDGKIYMLSDSHGGNDYTNDGTNYYEFFEKLIQKIIGDFLGTEGLDGFIQSLEDLIVWKNIKADPYINALQDYTNGSYGGPIGRKDVDNEEGYTEDEINKGKLWENAGVHKALDDLIDNITEIKGNIYDLNQHGEIYIGAGTAPTVKTFTMTNSDGTEISFQRPVLWINRNDNNGNGLIYYYFNHQWIPVSAMWSTPDENIKL